MSDSLVDSEKLLLITDIPGYTPQISRLLCMMNYARLITLESVEGLTVKELDYLYDKQSNSVGALLFHLAAVESIYKIETMKQREPNAEEWKKWKAGWELGQIARDEIRGNDLSYYTTIFK